MKQVLNYLLFSDGGAPVQTAVCLADEIEELAARRGCGFIEFNPSLNVWHCWVANGELQNFGPAPSAAHRITAQGWVDDRSLQDRRLACWEQVKLARRNEELSPLVVDGLTYDADADSQTKIAGAVQMALIAGSGFSIEWTLADNSQATLTAAQMVAVGVALGQRTAGIYATARALREQIDAATSQAELDAIVWPNQAG